MTSIAIIAAAGWKGAGHRSGMADRPEALLPLGDGTTIISRLVNQLKALGFLSIVGVGRPGCLYPRVAEYLSGANPRQERFMPEDVAHIGRTISPWKWEDVEYVAQFAVPFIVPVPERGNWHNFARTVFDIIGYSNWKRLLLMTGDYVFTDAFLKDVVNCPCPCQAEMLSTGHVVFLLDPAGARIYYETMEAHQGFRQTTPRAELERAGIPLVRVDATQGWLDVDYHHDYSGIVQRIEENPAWKS